MLDRFSTCSVVTGTVADGGCGAGGVGGSTVAGFTASLGLVIKTFFKCFKVVDGTF